MSDVFISYSRKDGDFVRRLHDALAARNREAWVDWEDIPPTAQWWAEICAGIEASDTFAFVISPDSARSKPCFDEIEHATKHNKRIVPILRREITEEPDRQRIHPAINIHNWIFFRDEDDFDTASQTLLTAIDTDLDHVHAHTRLLMRAQEWDSIGRKDNPLLHGRDLAEAEVWLAASVGKEPKPTDLHAAYILASRRAANRFQRAVLAGVSVALIVALGLAVLSFGLFRQSENRRAESNWRGTAVALQAATSTVARGDAQYKAQTAVAAQSTSFANERLARTQVVIAQNNEATAVYQEGVSRSMALAAQSQLDLEGSSPERSVLLALEALENYPYTWQAERALSLATQNDRLRLVLSGDRAVWSPNGARIVTTNYDKVAKVWDAATGSELLVLSGHLETINDVAWSPDGTQIVTASYDNTAKVWDAATGSELFSLAGHTDGVWDAAWSPDGTHIMTTSYDNTAKVWDVATGSELFPLAGQVNSEYFDAEWSPDGTHILTIEDELVTVWDAVTGQSLLTFNGTYAEWSPDSTRLLMTDEDGPAKVQDATTGEELLILPGTLTAGWSPDGKRIVSISDFYYSTMEIWDAMTGEKLVSFAIHSGEVIVSLAWSPDSTRIVTCITQLTNLMDLTPREDGAMTIWDAATGEGLLTLTEHQGFVNDVAWSPDQKYILTASDDGTVKIWDAQRNVLAAIDGMLLTTWSPDGKYVLINSPNLGSGGSVQIWNAATGEKQLNLIEYDGFSFAAAWSPDGTRVLVGITLIHTSSQTQDVVRFETKVLVWDAKTGKESLELITLPEDTELSSGVLVVAWSPDGTRILTCIVSNISGSITQVWDAQTGSEVFTLADLTEVLNSASWSPDGTLILTATQSGSVQIWTAEGTLLRSFNAPDGVLSAAWSPDGTRIVTTSDDRLVRIWDAATGSELLALLGHLEAVNSAAWSPNGKRMVTGSDDGTVKVWNATTGQELFTLASYTGRVLSVDWSQDGTHIVAGGDGTATIWHAWQTTDDLIAYAKECCAVRELTLDERARFNLPPK